MQPEIQHDAVLKAENLAKNYGENRVVNGINIEVKAGEVVGLLGPNGAGKTTSFRMLIGFTDPTEGRVFFNDREITSLPIHKRALLGISYLPQQTSIFKRMTVRENLMAVLQGRGYPKKEIRPIVNRLIDELGIGYVEHQVASSLSGGEMRRVEIARALTTNPTFIFLDEPFTGIDPPTVEDIQGIIRELAEKRGLGILITDHNVRETLHITDRSYMMAGGNVLVSGTVDEILANEQIREVYITKSIADDLSKISLSSKELNKIKEESKKEAEENS